MRYRVTMIDETDSEFELRFLTEKDVGMLPFAYPDAYVLRVRADDSLEEEERIEF